MAKKPEQVAHRGSQVSAGKETEEVDPERMMVVVVEMELNQEMVVG